jgi:hypothetical protein
MCVFQMVAYEKALICMKRCQNLIVQMKCYVWVPILNEDHMILMKSILDEDEKSGRRWMTVRIILHNNFFIPYTSRS